ncbi:CDF family Co(II)/Ni(II) efflux transporter DmeF [Niveibacterium sp. SC-1]|uniref:CDF family Co(II)/Ni(II) efflux transporter DmeF n=1 Tax=Niveibacterium sp. SC-1 TaxID=3135646 RepID=UPI00311D3B4E
MPSSSPGAERWRHSHAFDEGNPLAERNTRLAIALTAFMMVAEIFGGWVFNSMALLADGWHMSSHVLALGLAAFAYASARKLASDTRFAFGTWKIEILGSYTSALLLGLIALFMLYESALRLASPAPIRYGQAIVVAAIGLAVNLICAWLLKGAHHGHAHHHGHDHAHHGHGDLNLQSAYVHVLADAATSVLAILALTGGMLWGAAWLDPLMGIVGAVVVGVWAYRLLRDSGRVLLDAEMDAPVVAEVREVIEAAPIAIDIADLHVWRVGTGKYACILCLVTETSLDADTVRTWLSIHEELVHVSVEINRRGQALTGQDALVAG